MKSAGKLVVSHLETSPFERGLRSFFEYRDLGLKEATQGSVVAHLIRPLPGVAHISTLHRHECTFQMVYVTRGWVRFHYEGTGEVLLKQGSCVYQPPGIVHREIAHSDDLEMLEIVSPADFGTAEAKT